MTHPNLAAIKAGLAAAGNPVTAAFLQHMHDIHPADRLPARAAFDPMAVVSLLPYLVLVEIHRETPQHMRFYVRVAGEMVLAAAPVPLMNRYIESSVNLGKAPDDSQSRIVDIRRQVAETGVAVHWRGRVDIPFRFNFADVELAHCPLADDGVTPDRILSAFFYHGVQSDA